MRSDLKASIVGIFGCIGLLLVMIAWLSGVATNDHSAFNSHILYIGSGFFAVVTIVYLVPLVWNALTIQTIVIQVRPNNAVQQHHDLKNRLIAIDIEKSELLMQKKILEFPGSDSAKIIAHHHERIQG